MNLSRELRCAMFAAVCLLLPGVSAAADQPQRTWQDKSGRFQIEAKLVKQFDGKVQLLKADGLVVEVPVNALSEADQKYLKDLEGANPFAGGLPREQLENQAPPTRRTPKGINLFAPGARTRELPSDGPEIFLEQDVPVASLEADPVPATVKFKQFVQPLEKLDAYARASSPVVIDPAGPVLAVSVHRVGNAVSPANFGRIYLIDGQKRMPQVVLDLESTLKLFDHHPPSGRSLAVMGLDSSTERGGDLMLLEDLASGKPRAVARWHLPEWARPGFKPKVEFARLIDGQRAVVQVNDSVYLWDLSSGKVIHQISRVQASARLELSGTGKYLAVPTTSGCKLVHLAEGLLIGKVPFSDVLTPTARFSPDGKQLALVAGNQFVVWDLKQAEIVAEATFADPAGAFYGWIGNEYLLTQLAGLLDPSLGMPLWRYRLPTGGQPLTTAGGVAAVDKGSKATVIVSLPVPHPPVESVARRLAGGDTDLTLLHKGSAVSLRVEAIEGVDHQLMLAGLQSAVERAGWKVSEQAPFEIVATIGRGEQEQLSYRTLGATFRAPVQTVRMTPYTAGLQIRHQGEVVWERASRNMVPSLLHLEPGQSLQKAINEYEKPDPAYFERLRLPPNILRADILKTIGTSSIREGQWNDYFWFLARICG